MEDFLEFKPARCKDCYKCLRECPIKAIEVKNHQAAIIKDRCILCGHCTMICPQNAKIVHSRKKDVEALLATGDKIIASVAPSFISSFGAMDFSSMRIALCKIGFTDAEETAVGAEVVTAEYRKLLESGKYRNFITSACPAACRMIQMYFPKALKYLAPVDSPMIAHAKILRKRYPDAKIVFIGPCIAKRREAFESGIIDDVLTYEELNEIFTERNIIIDEITTLEQKGGHANLAKIYPISHGIIKSFDKLPGGYEYMAVDGANRCVDALEHIESLSNVFLEINTCQDACVNGPCALPHSGGSIKATSDVRDYVKSETTARPSAKVSDFGLSFATEYPRIRPSGTPASEKTIEEILRRTGKTKPEDELNCGACGYSTCREKAWAVYNGFADIEMCIPYMRQRAESMAYDIIQNSPEGLVVLDQDMKIIEINNKAKEMLGIVAKTDLKGLPAVDYFNPSDYLIAWNSKKNSEQKRVFIRETNKYIDLSIKDRKSVV